MIRSMYSGITGMKNFQTKLDVIGNNIANVNTYGFKKGRVMFKDMVSQTISGASGPTNTKGGVNPKQVGLGSQLSAVDTDDTQGSLQPTGRVLDVGIQGDGYLMVSDGTNIWYTRAGNLYLNSEGNVITASGQYVLSANSNLESITNPDGSVTAAEMAEIIEASKIQLNNGNIDEIENLSISEDGKISFIAGGVLNEGTEPQIGLARFANTGGLQKVGENMYQQTANSGNATVLSPDSNGAGKLVSGTLEMSNVDLSEEFTEMIVAQRGFQANTRIITTSDEILQELLNIKR